MAERKVDCCEAWAKAQCAGTDNEMYGRLLYGPPKWGEEWVMGSDLPPIKFCPWCGASKNAGERGALMPLTFKGYCPHCKKFTEHTDFSIEPSAKCKECGNDPYEPRAIKIRQKGLDMFKDAVLLERIKAGEKSNV